MPVTPTIAEEFFARQMAMFHGGTMLSGGNTIASLSGCGTGWYWEVERYVDGHWREYVSAARVVIEVR